MTSVVRVLAQGLRSPEGPVVFDDGSVAVVESLASRVTRIAADGTVSLVARTGGGPNGMAWSADGMLVADNGGLGQPNPMPGRLVRIRPQGAVETLADGLGAPNDVCVAGDEVWFTDPRVNWYEPDGRRGAIYRWRAGDLVLDHDGMDYPNGIGVAPDGALVVAESRTGVLHRRSTAGAWSAWAHCPDGAPDGFAFATDGTCVVCCFDTGVVWALSPTGHATELIRFDDGTAPTNCALAGSGVLVVTDSAHGRLLALDVPWEPALGVAEAGGEGSHA